VSKHDNTGGVEWSEWSEWSGVEWSMVKTVKAEMLDTDSTLFCTIICHEQ